MEKKLGPLTTTVHIQVLVFIWNKTFWKKTFSREYICNDQIISDSLKATKFHQYETVHDSPHKRL